VKILVVEDDPTVGPYVKRGLEEHQNHVDLVDDGLEALRLASGGLYDLLVLDLRLPGMTGLEIVRTLRDRGVTTPILILTAQDAVDFKVQVLRAGADDYVTKPFSLDELVARVDAVLRRTGTTAEPLPLLDLGDGVIVDLDGHSVTRGRRVEKLSAMEAGILRCLAARAGRATGRAQILSEVWGRYAAVSDRTIDFHVKNLRRKIEDDPENPTRLLTDHGVGYRLAISPPPHNSDPRRA
jgi:DNA-binding response OmpR family regulator